MKSRYVCTWSANVGDINRNKLRFGYSGMRCRIRVSIQGSGTRISGYPLRSLDITNISRGQFDQGPILQRDLSPDLDLNLRLWS